MAAQPPQPCIFFQQGRCRNGSRCKFSHQPSTGPGPSSSAFSESWRKPKESSGEGTAALLTATRAQEPWRIPAPAVTAEDLRRLKASTKSSKGPPSGLFVPCKFFQRGCCSHGSTCAFAHIEDNTQSPSSVATEARVKGKGPLIGETAKPEPDVDHVETVPQETEVRIMGSTLSVTFGPGLAIIDVGSASDTSIITIQNLQMNTSAEKVKELLSSLEPDLPEEVIRVISIEDATYATVKFQDASIAQEAVRQLDGTSYEDNRLSVKPYQFKGLANVSQSATRVSCTWFAPSRIASIGVATHSAAQRAMQICQGMRIKGRKAECKLQSSYDYGFHRPSRGEITVGNLTSETTEQDLRRIFRNAGVKVQSVYLHDPTYELSPSDALFNIVKLFEQQKSDIEGYDIVSLPGARKSKAIIRFRTAVAALDAVRNYNGKPQHFLAGSKIFLQPIYTANFKIAPEIQRAVSKELTSLAAEQPQGVQIRVFSGGGGSHTLATVRITGQDKKEVSVAKSMVGKIVRGQLVQKKTDEGEPLWDPFWATVDGIQKITEIGRDTKTFIFCDKRKSQLFLFGTTENQEKAMERLHESMASIGEKGHEIPMEGMAWKNFMRGGLRTLQEKYGADKVKVNVVKRCIIFVGPPKELEEALKSLENTAGEGSPGDVAEAYCPICFDTAENPTQFSSCQHAYCLSCLKDYIKSTTATRKFPITCVGEGTDSTVCGRALDIPILATILSPIEHDSIISSAFNDHVRCHPDEYSYCPTPNCNTVYRTSPSGDGKVFSCVDCLLEICTSCNVETHDGLSCADFRLSKHSDEKADRLFEQWKMQNGVHSCPACGTDIQKASGCNHITCGSCKAHICWKCLKVFAVAQEVYDHMNREHGGIGIDWV